MSHKKVNYNEIASTYNERYEAGSFEGIASTLKSLIQESSAYRILEVGCGTCHWLAGLQGLERQFYGLDISPGMLKQANQGLKSAYLVCGNANCLPFVDAYLDMIFCVNAIHHFDQKQKFISQARQALRSDGLLAIIGMDPHNTWLKMLCEIGVAGIAVMIWIVIALVLSARQTAPGYAFVSWGLVALLGVAVMSASLVYHKFVWYFMMLVAAAPRVFPREPEPRSDDALLADHRRIRALE